MRKKIMWLSLVLVSCVAHSMAYAQVNVEDYLNTDGTVNEAAITAAVKANPNQADLAAQIAAALAAKFPNQAADIAVIVARLVPEQAAAVAAAPVTEPVPSLSVVLEPAMV